MSTLEQAMERLSTDREFRAEVLENTNEALAGYQLGAGDIDRILQQAEMIEAEVQTNPMESTESDHGQADAGGSKN
jgi:hypothetical protein